MSDGDACDMFFQVRATLCERAFTRDILPPVAQQCQHVVLSDLFCVGCVACRGVRCDGLAVNSLSNNEPFRKSLGFQVAQYQRNPVKWISCLCWNPSQSTMLHMAISGLGTSLRKSACEIAPSNMLASVRDERTSGRRGGLFTRACASACSGSIRAGLCK